MFCKVEKILFFVKNMLFKGVLAIYKYIESVIKLSLNIFKRHNTISSFSNGVT